MEQHPLAGALPEVLDDGSLPVGRQPFHGDVIKLEHEGFVTWAVRAEAVLLGNGVKTSLG